MDSLNNYIQEYTQQLEKGRIQKAYKGIIAFMSELRTELGNKYPDFTSSALYVGYMDMTYFGFTPPAFNDKKLKLAIVFVHETCRFELWLAGKNRQIQAEYHELLGQKELGAYVLSPIQPGVDAIIAESIVEQPDFDHFKELKQQIEAHIIRFSEDLNEILAD
ncbi:DUF7000 family protein [Acetobacterium bakii]|uniref:DUF7000 domain-containing protein n=1 Tax=Acetobacterium bakii TaxID=52689 RepID=A0A0L6TZ72_9FIRM|nr:hypothetical protein [Acetobacterium bakii]KNZ40845.1 hypothetical protein AKG39_15430 [Acetobacterium bakii]